MTKTMYVARSWGPSIGAVQVERESAHYVTIVGETRRIAKRAESESVFDTYDSAYEHIRSELAKRVRATNAECVTAQEKLNKFVTEWRTRWAAS
jgi:oligoribonuclease (3'-5' exoribonuclease)